MSIPTTPRHARPRRRRGRLAVLLVALLLLPSAVVTALEGRDLDEVIDVDTDNISVGTPVLDLTAATRPNLTITVPVENTASATAVTVAMFPGPPSVCTPATTSVAPGDSSMVSCTRPAPSASDLDDDNRLPIVLRLSVPGDPDVDVVTLNEDEDDAALRTPVLTILDGSLAASPPGTAPIVVDEPYRVRMTVTNSSTVTFREIEGARLGLLAAESCTIVTPQDATTVPAGTSATVACDWNGGPSLRDQTTLEIDLDVAAREAPVRLSTTIDLSDVPLGTDGDDGDDQPVVTEPGDDGDLNEDLDLPGIDDPDVAAPEAGADVGDATALPVTGMQLLGLLLTLGLAAALIGWWMTRYTDERDGFVRVQ